MDGLGFDINGLEAQRNLLWDMEFKYLDDRSTYGFYSFIWPIGAIALGWYKWPDVSIWHWVIGAVGSIILPVLWLHTWFVVRHIQKNLKAVQAELNRLERQGFY